MEGMVEGIVTWVINSLNVDRLPRISHQVSNGDGSLCQIKLHIRSTRRYLAVFLYSRMSVPLNRLIFCI